MENFSKNSRNFFCFFDFGFGLEILRCNIKKSLIFYPKLSTFHVNLKLTENQLITN